MEEIEYEGEEGGYEENNENLNQTGASEKARRNYPKHVKGQKNEWVGIVQHHQEINDELGKIERDIKLLSAKNLNTEYEKNQIANYEKRKKELMQKQKESQEILEKQKMYQRDVNQYKQDKVLMQNQISQTYNQILQEKGDIMKKYKNEEMNLERAILEENFRKMEQQQRESLEKREREKNIFHSGLQDKEKIKLQQNFDQLKSKNEINEMNKMSEMKQIIKEENYKNFFKLCSDNQAYYQNLHKSQVLTPYLEKQDRIKQMIEKNFDEENRKKFQKELDRLKKKQEDSLFARNVNEIQISEKQKMKDLEKLEKQVLNEERMKDLQEYNNFLDYKKNQKVQQMNDYKQKLDNQFDAKRNMDLNALRMTKNEKKLNYNDLQAFKEVDPSLYAMIPGWSPQIGGLKIKKKLQEVQVPLNEEPMNKKPVFSPNIFSAKNLVPQNNAAVKTVPNEQEISKSDFNAQNRAKMNLLYGHNPITNPTPYNNQNPYLAKEFNQRKNLLSQIGQSSLI